MSEESGGEAFNDPRQCGQSENFHRIISNVFPIPAKRALRKNNYGINSPEIKKKLQPWSKIYLQSF